MRAGPVLSAVYSIVSVAFVFGPGKGPGVERSVVTKLESVDAGVIAEPNDKIEITVTEPPPAKVTRNLPDVLDFVKHGCAASAPIRHP